MPNALTRAMRARRGGVPYVDLTVTNPTCVGLGPDAFAQGVERLILLVEALSQE